MKLFLSDPSPTGEKGPSPFAPLEFQVLTYDEIFSHLRAHNFDYTNALLVSDTGAQLFHAVRSLGDRVWVIIFHSDRE